MNKIKIKICGFTKIKDIKKAILEGINIIGLIFYKKSLRYININQLKKIKKIIPPFINIIGIFVNPKIKEIKNILNNINLSLLQFHGNESPKKCKKISKKFNIPFIKAINIKYFYTKFNIHKYYIYYTLNNIYFYGLLLDTFSKKYGGTGKKFNWNVIPKNIKNKIVLSGGINVNDINNIILNINPYAIDICSGVEKKIGIKNIKKIKKIINLNNLNNFYLNIK